MCECCGGDCKLTNMECEKCKLWDKGAKLNGYSSGMCADCFDKNYVNVNCEWGGSVNCMKSNGEIVNVADELNRLEKEKTKNL